MSKVSTSKPSHICKYCDKECGSRNLLEIHRRVHTGERPFSCKLCDYSAVEKSNLEVHIQRHLNEKPFKCPESNCYYAACTKGDIISHQTTHSGLKMFECPISTCSSKFTRKHSLLVHHRTVHLGEKRVECPISGCSHKSAQQSGLILHMTTHEENPAKPFKCPKCPHKAKTKSMLNVHVRFVHSEERKFKCPKSKDGCSFTAKTQRDLNRHADSHDEKTLKCSHPNCDYKTNLKQGLEKHMEIHGSDSDKRYKCRICGYSSHQSGNLTTHMRSHTKETPFKCTVEGCQYQAKTSARVKLHVRTVHDKIRPFKCSLCSYAGGQRVHLRTHQNAMHPQ